MACGTGKTRVMKELVGNVSGKAPWCLCMARTGLPPAEFVEFVKCWMCWTVVTFADLS